MSDVFDDTLKAAADTFFKLPGAERVTYLPGVGASRGIWAVISRRAAGPMAGVSGGSLPAFEVLVKNHATEGIESDVVDCGVDKIRCGKRVDNRPVVMRLTEILSQDAAMMSLAAK